MMNMEEKDLTVSEFLATLEGEGGRYEIETPQGWVLINAFYKRGVRECCVTTTETHELTSSVDHLLMADGGWLQAQNLDVQTDAVQTNNGFENVLAVETAKPQEVYDFWINSKEHAYYANGLVSHNCGKTETVELVARDCGFARVYQINGYADMPSSSFLGSKTVAVDPKSMQSYVTHAKGILERAMVHGLELDASGNAVLDEDGKVKVVGAPAVLFIDEFAGLSETVAFVLNRALQIPREPGMSRVVEIDTDGGRMVKSHPGWCVILAGNVIGRGFASEAEAAYTAQSTAQDMSFLDRITATFTFGYNLVAERQIVMEKIQDDTIAAKILQFRDALREAYCRRTVETLISTRGLISLCDAIRVMKRAGFVGLDAVGRAVYRTMFSGLVDTEKKAWNEAANLAFGVDVAKKYGSSDKLWVPEFK